MHRPDVVLNHPKRDDNRRPRSKRNERESPKSDTDSEQRQHHRQILTHCQRMGPADVNVK